MERALRAHMLPKSTEVNLTTTIRQYTGLITDCGDGPEEERLVVDEVTKIPFVRDTLVSTPV